jgi:hypothetical protein
MTDADLDWKGYENAVFETLQLYYPDAVIQRNVKRQGRFSKVNRQVDIYIEVPSINIKICVECKYYNKSIDVKTVESFIGMAADLEVDVGIMITEKGYSQAALKRAHFNPADIELDILNLDELKELQGSLAFPYAGKHAALLIAPFGWVIDATKTDSAICMLYQRGLTQSEALEEMEIAYVNYWDRSKKGANLFDLINLQEENIRLHTSVSGLNLIKIEYLPCYKRDDCRTKIRLVEIGEYPGIELTAFIEFEEFIFFCVWFSKPLHLKRNLRKLNLMLKSTVAITLFEM